MIELREYQQKLIYDIKRKLNKKSICVVAPCGSGKSIVQGMIAKGATDKGNRVLFLVHRKELCEQIEDTFFNLCGVNPDLCKIGMVQTITRRLDKEEKPVIIITDENHHCLAKSYMKIYDYFPEAIKLGFTATPIRLGGKGLHPVYKELVSGPTVQWLINNKFLAPFKLYSKKLVDTSNLHIRQGDFKQDEVNEMMEKNTIYGDTIKNYKELAEGKKTIVYCSSIKASEETAKSFNDNDIKAKHLDGKTNKKDREQAIKDFREGKITVLCNVDLFGEGFDVPDCECVALLRPTKSLSLYIQQSMRSMRFKENKQAVIIDHVGNCFEHGLPDFDFSWSLEDKEKKTRKKKNDEDEEKIKTCKQCFAVFAPGLKICPFCGYEAPVTQRAEKKVVAANLEEISNTIEIYRNMPFHKINYFNRLSEIIDFVIAKKKKLGVIYYQLEERNDDIVKTESDFKRWEKLAGYKRGWHKHQIKKYMEVQNDGT